MASTRNDIVQGTNLVLLDPDVAAAFPDAKAVNDALRHSCKKKSLGIQVEVIRANKRRNY